MSGFPCRLSASSRSVAIGLVLDECRDITSNECVVQTVLDLGLSHCEIGEALWPAVDEARNNLRAAASAHFSQENRHEV